jgi:hypothetical protein
VSRTAARPPLPRVLDRLSARRETHLRVCRAARTLKLAGLRRRTGQRQDVRWLGGSARPGQRGRERAALVALMVEQADHDLLEGALTVGEAHLAGRGYGGEALVG